MAVKKSMTPTVDSDAVDTINSATDGEPTGVTETHEDTTTPVVDVIPQSKVEVTPVEPDESKIPEPAEKNVKIRLRVNHRCCIAMERYDFKAGGVYTVPPNVKKVLNKAGLLAPL